MPTSVMPRMAAPILEPSTDFPTFEDEAPCHRAPLWAVALVMVGALIVGSIAGFAVGRAGAPHTVPAPCVSALQHADAALSAARMDLVTIESGALAVVDGESPEAYSLVQDARLAQTELAGLQSNFDAAAAACRG